MHRDINQLPAEVIMWGGGDQCRVNRPILEGLGARIAVIVDDTPNLIPPFEDIETLHGYDGFNAWMRGRDVGRFGFVIAIGNPFGWVRVDLHTRLTAYGLKPVSFAHPSALIMPDAEIGPGAQIMPGAIVNSWARLGTQVIVNSRAVVEHDNRIGDGVELAPGAVLCGRVEVGEGAWICAGATIKQGIRIGAGATVGAGSVVIRDVPPGATVVGVPAHRRTIASSPHIAPHMAPKGAAVGA